MNVIKIRNKLQNKEPRNTVLANLLKLAAVLNIQLDDQPDYVKQYSAYYKTKRGYHKRSVNSNEGWVLQSMPGWMNTKILVHPEDLKNAVLIVQGEKAHSRYMGEDTFKKIERRQ